MAVLVLGTGCDKERIAPAAPANVAPSVLIDYKKESTIAVEDIRTLATLAPFVHRGIVVPDGIAYGVEVYTVRYRTVYRNGEPIEASGAAFFPVGAGVIRKLVSFQHGTITAQGDAPSRMAQAGIKGAITAPELLIPAALAAYGLAVVLPDYIGFGVSAQTPHPYYVRQPTAVAVVDLIRATLELARKRGLNLAAPTRVQLAGYSEGGYATLATHEYIEREKPEGIALLGSFPAAGGYDIPHAQAFLLAQQEYHNPSYMAYVVYAYQHFLKWSPSALDDIFQQPYAALIPKLFNGAFPVPAINAQLTNRVPDLIRPELIAGLGKDGRYAYIVNALEDNSPIAWRPTLPVRLYHGTDDITVPYSNSEATLERLRKNGSTAVTLTELPGNHATAFIPYLNTVAPQLIAHAQDP